MKTKFIIILFGLYIFNNIFSQDNFKYHWEKIKENSKIDEFTNTEKGIFCGENSCNVNPMQAVDKNSFEVIKGSHYARDKKNIFYPLRITCKDYTNCGVCYCTNYIIKNADRDTFIYLGKDYAKDKKNVFFRGRIIKGANSDSFRVLEGPEYFHFAADKFHVYMYNKIFTGANPETFKFMEFKKIKAGNDSYREIMILTDNENTWEYDPPNDIKKVAPN